MDLWTVYMFIRKLTDPRDFVCFYTTIPWDKSNEIYRRNSLNRGNSENRTKIRFVVEKELEEKQKDKCRWQLCFIL